MSTSHEDFQREATTRGPSDRSFGWVFTLVFLFFGLWPIRHGKPIRPLCLALSGTLLLVTLIWPSLFHRPNQIWTKCGILLGKLVNPIIAAVLFYLVFTPMALILRWMGKDLLALAYDPDITSYWSQRNSSTGKSSMTDQF
jgi:hypothetical protein